MGAVGHTAQKLRREHLHPADDAFFRHGFAQIVSKFQKQVVHFARRRLVLGQSVHCFPGLAEDPGVGDRSTPDVDGVAADFVKPAHGVGGREHVSAARDWDRDVSFDFLNEIPVGVAAITLSACPAVERDHRSAAVLDQFCDLDAIDRIVIPAGSNLDGHRDCDGAFDFGQYLFELRQVAQQVGSAAAVNHLSGWAAAVDVDEISAGFLSDLGGPAHADFVIAEDLNRDRALFSLEAHHVMCAHISARQAFDADELGDDQAQTAALLGYAAKWRIGHSRHR